MPNEIPLAVVGGDVPGATSDVREEVLVRITQGSILTDQSLQYFSVRANIYTLEGLHDGVYEGEYQLTEKFADVFNRPPQPVPPFNVPQGPVYPVPINAYTKGLWTFSDGSSIAAVGTANFHAVKGSFGSNGGVLLWITGDQFITGGTGLYAGVKGLKTLGGSANMPTVPTQLSELFVARTVDAFRIIRGEFIGAGPFG